MRKVVASMHISLDGFTATTDGGMDWIKVDDEIFEYANFLTENADTALYGRVTWQMMDAYWPTADEAPNASKHDKDHSRWYNAVDKVVLSKTMQVKKADKTTFVHGDLPKIIQDLKKRNGKGILIFGSPGAVCSLMEHNLIDEYWLFVNPVILGQGIPMFARLDQRQELVHMTTKVFSCGVTGVNYIRK